MRQSCFHIHDLGVDNLSFQWLLFWVSTMHPVCLLMISKRHIEKRELFQLRQELDTTNEKAQELLKGALLMVSHDASSALFNGFFAVRELEKILTSKSIEDEDLSESLLLAKNSLNDISDVIQTAKTCLIVAGARIQIPSQKIDLTEVLILTYSYLNILAEYNKIKLIYNRPNRVYSIRGDKLVFKISIFSNFLTNAIKYSSTGSSVRIYVKILGSKVRVSIFDKGIGIPKNVIESATAGNDVLSLVQAGDKDSNGQGLSHAIAMTKYFGGDVSIRSNVSDVKGLSGTTVVIDFPIYS